MLSRSGLVRGCLVCGVDLTLTFSASGGGVHLFPALFPFQFSSQHLSAHRLSARASIGVDIGHVVEPGLIAERSADSLERFHPVSMLRRKRTNLQSATPHGDMITRSIRRRICRGCELQCSVRGGASRGVAACRGTRDFTNEVNARRPSQTLADPRRPC